jgi:hypothetical protein
MILSLLASTLVFAQQITFNKDSASYIMVDSSVLEDQFDLHAVARSWAIDNFSDTTELFRLDDMDSGELTGKGSFHLSKKDKTVCTFSYKIASRDKKYESQIFDIVMEKSGQNYRQPYGSLLQSGKASKKTVDQINDGVRALLADLHMKMKQPKK